ncbi:hypothetical protein [Burkholderia pyrrocinia]|uniref:hypothetical protein n=1 Tax=Burkholderia pyrrocinia TaxID=60550 RepID=UPI002AAFB434|nr:hypothetical protein [Burkholderia pyrrocinia]
MPAIRKNVRLIFFAALALALIGCLIYLGSVKILLFMIGNKSLVIATIAAILLIWVVYLLVKMKVRRKTKVVIILSLPIVVYTCACLFNLLLPVQYGRCGFYTQKLNGGVRSINGQTYNINMCGIGGYNMRSGDDVRLQVFGESGHLLAQRHFTVNWNDTYPNALKYGPDHMTYYDNNGDGKESKISFPPTTVDWIRARMPFFD